ncbi:hypothetical protein J2746_000938 [Methanolobus bombayensis]|nr:hypothetical protein [Methanolobus bombayensis]
MASVILISAYSAELLQSFTRHDLEAFVFIGRITEKIK